MRKIYATIGKPSELLELRSAIVYFNIEKVIITIINKKRIDKNIIKLFFESDLPNINVDFLNYNFDKGVNDYKLFLSDYIEEIDYFALSLYFNRHIYKLSPYLKTKNKKIIHISDGVTNAFSLFGYILGFRTKGLFSFFKSMIIYFEYKKAKADVTFFSLYPNKSCFARKTLPLDNQNTKFPGDINLINDCDILLVPGWGMSTNDLIDFFDITKKYCATSKNLEIEIDQINYPIKQYITAEDVINSRRIKRVVGTPSTALIFAKTNYPDIQVDCILTGVLNKTFGLFYEREFMKLGKKLGINFFSHKL